MHRIVGECDLAASPFSASAARECYRDMVRARQFDDRAVSLQRRGWMSGYPPFRGQEASQVGAAHAMTDRDWLVPTYRSNALQTARGVPMSDLLAFRRGFPEYNSGHDLPVFPQAVPIATQLPHAVGLGMAADYRDDDLAVVAYLGDGATSEGDFHEAMNFAGVFDAPVVFFCENNGYAISTTTDRQTAAPTIAGKADAYGMAAGQVDGNDPLAVREMVATGIDRARDGSPVLVESLTYRQGAHTTSDDPSRYRDDPDLPEWRTADPLDRLEQYCREQGVLDDEAVASIREAAEAEVAEATERAETIGSPEPEDVFDWVYEELPGRLRSQRAEISGREDLLELDR